jgi:uncharacterized peroxidase-related enzyme
MSPFLEELKKEVGFVPNLAAAMAESPALIETFVTVRKILARSTFPPMERETISLAVSVANDCSYCIAAHATFAKMAGMADASLDALRAGATPADARLAALAEYTRHLLANRGHAEDEAKVALLGAGFTNAQLLEVIAVIAFTTIANYAHNITHCAIDVQFQAQAA